MKLYWTWRKKKQTKISRNSLMFHQTLFLLGKKIKLKCLKFFIKEIWQKGGEGWYIWSSQQSCSQMVKKNQSWKCLNYWFAGERKSLIFCKVIKFQNFSGISWIARQTCLKTLLYNNNLGMMINFSLSVNNASFSLTALPCIITLDFSLPALRK